MTTDLTKRLNVRQTVQAFREACDLIRSGYATVEKAKATLDSAFLLGGEHISRMPIQEMHGREPHWERPEDTIHEVEKQAWRAIVDRLELRRFLSVKRWDELQKNLEAGKMGELTEEKALQLLQSFAGQFDELIAEAVTEVYNFLRPWNSSKKTNTPFRVGKRVILEGYLSVWSLPAFQPAYQREQQLTALENVFSSLDGKGQVTKTHWSQLSEAIRRSQDGKGQTEYFRFKCFRNRNLHLEFLRPDLVHELNRIAGNRSLAT